MINAKDLRIGNVFIRELHTSRGSECDHEFILTENEMGKLFGDNLSLALQDLHGVPLTEDILLKWGFGNKRNTNINGCIEYTYLNSMNLSKSYDLILTIHNGIYRLYYKLEIIGVRRLKYIHQFQNFFQIITEKELTVNL